jgi:TamB, inner membrane protein subunit of TAM complex
MKNFYRFFYILAICVIFFFTLTVALTITLNTKWGKNKLLNIATILSKEKAIDISFDNLTGLLPFQFKLSNVTLVFDKDKSIYIGKLSFRPSYSKLLKKTLSFKQFSASNIIVKGFDQTTTTKDPKFLDKLNFAIQVKSYRLSNLKIEGIQNNFDVEGKIRIERDFDYVSIKAHINETTSSNNYLDLKFKANKNRLFKFDLSGKLNDENALKTYINLPFENNLTFKTKLKGSWGSLIGLIFSTKQELKDIKGTFNLFFDEFKNIETVIANNLEINGDININPNKTVKLQKIKAFNDYLDAKGFLIFDSFIKLQKANIFLDIYTFEDPKNLKLLSPVKTTIDVENKGDNYSLKIDSNITSFLYNDIAILNSKFNLDGLIINKKLQSKCSYTATFQQRNLQFTSDITQSKDSINLASLKFKSDFLNTTGNLKFYSLNNILGDLRLNISDLSMLEIIFPNLFIDGSLKGNMHIDTIDKNLVNIAIDINNVEYNKIGSSVGHLNLTIKSPFESPTFNVDAEFTASRIYNTSFQSIAFNTNTEQENWPIEIKTKGEKIDANLNGYWHFNKQSFNLNIQELFGTLYNQSFFLVEPFDISFVKEQELQISKFLISMENGFLSSNLNLKQDNGSFSLNAINFPIDLISLNTIELSVQGFVTGNISIETNKNNTNGKFLFNTKNTKFYNPDETEALIGSGKIEGQIKNNILEINSNFQSNDKVILNSFLSFGIQLNPFPFKLSVINQKPLNGKILYDARAEDLLDFIDLGFNFVRGDLKCDLNLSGTVLEPTIIGECVLTNGTYENYLAGVYLKHINAKIIGKENKLELTELSAKGIKDGKITATGELVLNYLEHFPYFLDADLDKIQIVKLDFFEGKVKGNAHLDGNIKHAILTSDALITEGEFSIPERFKSKVPTLAVTYINAPEDFKSPIKKEKFLFYLDVHLNAPKNIFIKGRGLSGELKGEIKLEGTIDNLITRGRLDLIKGDFLFSGHSFDLTKGEFVFGEEGALPFLFLSAQTTIQGVTINATLSGQLDSPTLEFKSLPPLPLSSILSYLLFGSDISEISALQAVTLASTAGSLAGGRTDILEATRKTLGVDRLAVVSSPGSVGDEDFAVQIGKYVAKGILVSFSQGVEQGSTNIIVEVDLKHGFIFSAETVQQEEQGRFSLKWNRNF